MELAILGVIVVVVCAVGLWQASSTVRTRDAARSQQDSRRVEILKQALVEMQKIMEAALKEIEEI